MVKKLLMGNEAVAQGAIEAGVNVVTGYPGTPSTEVLETVARENPGDIYVEWSVNEKVAMEIAAGASYAGARSMVTMKQVGLNVAADPLMGLSYIGIKGGMVVVVADDPGPFSSQTEQDTRHFARFANLPVFDPSSPEEARAMTKEAFRLSEEVGLPVFLRLTTRVCHSTATVEVQEVKEIREVAGFVKSPKWVIFPPLAYRNHLRLEKLQEELAELFSKNPFNCVEGSGSLGIAVSGIAYLYFSEVLEALRTPFTIFKVGNPYPLPRKKAEEFLSRVDKVLVLEELDPVVEEQLLELSANSQKRVPICGKKSGHLPKAGEYTFEIVDQAVRNFAEVEIRDVLPLLERAELPHRPPTLCAGCPHRASFYLFKRALGRRKAVFTGDIGCYTLGNAAPLEAVDTCLCMGAGITIAQGLTRANKGSKQIAFIGDSTFFHTGIPGILNAVYNGTEITLAVLDNRTTAMTGHQPHPGTGETMMGTKDERINIPAILSACGVKWVQEVNPFDSGEALEVIKEAVDYPGVSAVVLNAPCAKIQKSASPYRILDNCRECRRCVTDLGCPAISLHGGKPEIDAAQCTGCGLCAYVCPHGAIGGEQDEV